MLDKSSFWPKWTNGPTPTVSPTVTLWWRDAQLLPLKLRAGSNPERRKSRRRIWTISMLAFVAIWWLIAFMLFTQSFWRVPEDTVLSGCAENWQVWKPDCGVNATGCLPAYEPLPDGSIREMRLKCPMGCFRGSWKWAETLVGTEQVQYRPYVIGGSRKSENSNYRADSSPCAAALHAGFISQYTGGTFKLRFEGPQESFPGATGEYGVESITFDAPFPASFSVHEDRVSGGSDYRIYITAFCLIVSYVFGYFCVNITLFYWVQFLTTFLTLVMVADPIYDFTRAAGPTSLTVREMWLSLAIERLLPAVMGGYIIYQAAIKHMIGTDKNPALQADDCAYFNVDEEPETIEDGSESDRGGYEKQELPRSLGTPSLSRALLWVSGLWCGILENYTFAILPVDRLMISDLNARPEGVIVVIVFAVIIFAATASQTYIIWRAGLFRRYIVIYVSLVLVLVGLGIIGALNNLELRIHHYIMGLVLVTGASTYNHLGFLYQGLLVGLYINGVGRWGFGSTLESHAALARGSVVNQEIELTLADGELSWGPPPGPGIYTPSLMVDDVIVLSAAGMDSGIDMEYIASVVNRYPTFVRAGYVDGGYSLPLVV